MKHYWAFDLASKAGWAIQHAQTIESGAWLLKNKGDCGNGMMFCRLRARLNELCSAYGLPEYISFEDQLMRGAATRAVIYGLRGTLEQWAAERGVPTRPVNINTIKAVARRVLGRKGGVKKELTLPAASMIAGREIEDEDEADAICLLEVPI